MGRPKSQTVEYFPHDCKPDGTTMYILEHRYENNGYAFWFKLLELLGTSEGHFLDCRNSNRWEFLQAKTHLDGNTCNEILNLLAKLEAIDAELWKHKIIWCQKYVNRLASVYANRRVEIPLRPSFYIQEPQPDEVPMGSTGVSTDKNPQSKGSKVKEVKEDIVEDKKQPSTCSIFDYRMTILLRKHVETYKSTKPKTQAQLKKWANAFRLMRKEDRVEPHDIRHWLLWAINDEFWRGNVLSAAKFRQHIQRGTIQAAIARELKQREGRGEPSEASQERDKVARERSRAQARKSREETEAAEREADRLKGLRVTNPVKWAKGVLGDKEITEEKLQKMLASRFTLGFFREAVEILLEESERSSHA